MAKAHRKRPAILKPDPYQLFELEQAVDALREHVRTLSLQFDVLGFDALHSEVAVIDARSSLARVSKLLNRITEVTGWHPTIADCLDRLRAKVDALAQHLPRVDHEDESLLGTAVQVLHRHRIELVGPSEWAQKLTLIAARIAGVDPRTIRSRQRTGKLARYVHGKVDRQELVEFQKRK